MKKTNINAQNVEYIAYRFIGYPSNGTVGFLSSYIGACRFLWNQFVSDSREYYKQTGLCFKKTPAAYKKEEGLEWLKQIDSLALANVQLNYEKALKAFFNKTSGYPEFKKKGLCKNSYTTCVSNSDKPNLRLDANMLTLPKIKEPIRLKLHRKIRKGGILKSCTVIHEQNGKWFFSLLYEYPKTERENVLPDNSEFTHIGLDMSLPNLYVDSHGESPKYEKVYAKNQERLSREQRKLSHMVKGSNNYKKQKQYLAKLYSRTKNQRCDMLHKISKSLTDNYVLISIEDLNMKGMSQALNLGKSVHDNAWGMFTHMLEYKQLRKGHYLVRIDKWFPSSKTCSCCGYKNRELKLSDRIYICPYCGAVMDRDGNAAINIDREGLRILCEALNIQPAA